MQGSWMILFLLFSSICFGQSSPTPVPNRDPAGRQDFFRHDVERPADLVFPTTKIETQKISACPSLAVDSLKALGFSPIESVIEKHKQNFLPKWVDEKSELTAWIKKCDDRNSRAFNESIGIFAKNLTHQLRNKDCLFVGGIKDEMCFSGTSEMPPTEIARLETISGDSADETEFAKELEKILMTDQKESVILLFDQLNGSSILSQAQSGLMRHFQQGRPRNPLPFVMTMTIRYLEKLRTKNPKAFSVFAKKGENAENLRVLFRIAESSYLAWLEALSGLSLQPYGIESNSWKLYLDSKKILYNLK